MKSGLAVKRMKKVVKGLHWSDWFPNHPWTYEHYVQTIPYRDYK